MITPVNTWVCWYHSYVQSHHNTHTPEDCIDVWDMQVCFLFDMWFIVLDSESLSSVITPLCHYYRERSATLLKVMSNRTSLVFVKVVHTLPCSRLDANMLTCCSCQDYSFCREQEPGLMYRDVSTVMMGQQVRVLLYWSTAENIPLLLYMYV